MHKDKDGKPLVEGAFYFDSSRAGKIFHFSNYNEEGYAMASSSHFGYNPKPPTITENWKRIVDVKQYIGFQNLNLKNLRNNLSWFEKEIEKAGQEPPQGSESSERRNEDIQPVTSRSERCLGGSDKWAIGHDPWPKGQ